MICHRSGCTNPTKKGYYGMINFYCSKECRLEVVKRKNHQTFLKNQLEKKLDKHT